MARGSRRDRVARSCRLSGSRSPSRPSGSSSLTSTRSTSAPPRALAGEARPCSSTASGSPSKTASTARRGGCAPSRRRRALGARRRVVSRKKTPWTRPWTTTRRRITVDVAQSSSSPRRSRRVWPASWRLVELLDRDRRATGPRRRRAAPSPSLAIAWSVAGGISTRSPGGELLGVAGGGHRPGRRGRRRRPARPPRGSAAPATAPGGTSIQVTDMLREPSSPASMRMWERRRCHSCTAASDCRLTSTARFLADALGGAGVRATAQRTTRLTSLPGTTISLTTSLAVEVLARPSRSRARGASSSSSAASAPASIRSRSLPLTWTTRVTVSLARAAPGRPRARAAPRPARPSSRS